jgi:hypothetical protein
MEESSLQADCDALQAVVSALLETIPVFVRRIRVSRADLDGISRELASLKIILALLATDDNEGRHLPLPDTLREPIHGMISGCNTVVLEIERITQNSSDSQLSTNWSAPIKRTVDKLRRLLKAHRSLLEIAIDMLQL